MPKLVGWSDILSSHCTERLTNAHKQEIVKTIRRRHYNFTYFDHQNMSYCCPFFDDGCMISLNKSSLMKLWQKPMRKFQLGRDCSLWTQLNLSLLMKYY